MPGEHLGFVLDLLASNVRARLLDPNVCLQCFARSRIEGVTNKEVLKAVLDLVKRCSKRTEMFVEAYALLHGDKDPMADEKKLLNGVVLENLGRVIEVVKDLDRALDYLARANAVDISMPWYRFEAERYIEMLEGVAVKRIGVDRNPLKDVESIALLLDNAGEAVVDLVFAYTLAEKRYRVYVVARSQPYEVDVVLPEVVELAESVSRYLGVEPRAIEIVGTGSRYPAPAIDRVSTEVVNILRDVDLVVSKGIANFEAFLEYRPIDLEKVLFLLKAKCPPIAKYFGVEMGYAIVARGS